MPETARLSGGSDCTDLEFVEHERTPKPAMALGIQSHLAGLSLANTVDLLESLGVEALENRPRLGAESRSTARIWTASESDRARRTSDSHQRPAVLAVRCHQTSLTSGWLTRTSLLSTLLIHRPTTYFGFGCLQRLPRHSKRCFSANCRKT